MSEFTVTLDACVEGNQHNAWNRRLPDGETSDYEHAPDRVPPDDVWEAQVHGFDELDAAKDFVRSLPEDITTHVKLLAGDVVIYDQDADAEHLDAAGVDVEMPHTIDSALPDEPVEIPESSPPMPRQNPTPEAGQ